VTAASSDLAGAHPPERPAPRGKALAVLSLTALGVVYGDIGTSVLYALRECFSGTHSIELTEFNVLGVLSLIFWSLNFVISYKYISYVMRADNRGEGGILALLALIRPREGDRLGRRLLVMAGLFGAALLYGDGVITPAISVLSAVEGLSIAAPALPHWVVPLISAVILVVLFAFQSHGTARVGRVFGPIMIVWFISISLLGLSGIIRHPDVLKAVSPYYAFEFFVNDGLRGFLILGAVVLVVTGGEALYADMGHFGKRPIRVAWFGLVLPALLINYFGQGALLIADPGVVKNPFYGLVPGWALYAMVGIATTAAIIASQALISGAFSLTRQAVQLGYSPRVTVTHTSSTEAGQIYVPEVNWALMLACLGLVIGFGDSSSLAAAYGIAVTGTMTITTLLFANVALNRWQWPLWRVLGVTLLFLVVDLAFLGANLVKIEEGGWFPLAMALVVFTLLATWKKGRHFLILALRDSSLPLMEVIRDVDRRRLYRVPGTAVFMTSDPDGAPPVLLHHLKHNKVLHEKVILLSVQAEEIPQVPERDRVEFKELGCGFYQVIATYGFMESPDVPAVLQALALKGDAMDLGGLTVKLMETTFYLGRETLLPTGTARMARWRKSLFIVMARNAQSATAFFNLPPNRVVELGAQIQV
jgi:KUP system potassium uptake protein